MLLCKNCNLCISYKLIKLKIDWLNIVIDNSIVICKLDNISNIIYIEVILLIYIDWFEFFY